MLLSLWGHIHSIPTVGTQTEQSEQQQPETLLTHCLLWKQENGQKCFLLQTVSQRSCTQQLQIHEAVCEIHNWKSKVRWSLQPPPFLFLLQKMDVYGKLWKTVYCAVDLLRGSSFPIHGNEEWAINWALPGGSAQHRGRGRKGKTVQCCKWRWTICATQAWSI